MATPRFYISLYVRIHGCVGDESFCSIGSIPHADMADVDVVCSVWDTGGESECAA